MMQVVVLLAFGRFVFGIHISSTAWAAIPVALAGCLCFLAMGFAIGSMVSNPETGDAVSNVITNPMMFLSGVFFPVAAMPAFVQAIARVLPLYYLANGLRDTTVRGLSLTHVAGDIGVLLAATAVLAAVSLRMFRWEPSTYVERGRGPMRYQNVIVGGGLAGGMVAQEYREQGGDGSVAPDRPRGARPLPPPAAHQGVPPRREAGRGGLHAPGRVVAEPRGRGADRGRARRRSTWARGASPSPTARRSSTSGSSSRQARHRGSCPARASIRTIDDSQRARGHARGRRRGTWA